jgi:2-amino-4-hydroxy-6-hydroxymethyldihydropteridine diphosphokinase
VHNVILGLGSNKGGSIAILRGAIDDLRAHIRGLRAASMYRTAPMHIESQPDFFNTAVCGAFAGEPSLLLDIAHQVETKYGRDRARETRWGERSLDIDILLFGERVINEEGGGPLRELEVPHPRLKERRFALEPLLELDAEARDPLTGERYSAICARLDDQGVVRIA